MVDSSSPATPTCCQQGALAGLRSTAAWADALGRRDRIKYYNKNAKSRFCQELNDESYRSARPTCSSRPGCLQIKQGNPLSNDASKTQIRSDVFPTRPTAWIEKSPGMVEDSMWKRGFKGRLWSGSAAHHDGRCCPLTSRIKNEDISRPQRSHRNRHEWSPLSVRCGSGESDIASSFRKRSR